MAERNKRKQTEINKEASPKELRLRAKHREQDRKLYTYVGAAVAVAILLLLAGAIYTFLWIPRSTFASVGDQSISTQEFWNRMRYEKQSLTGQLNQLQSLEQQFGGQGYFTNQINQVQAKLSSSFALASDTLNTVMEEKIVLREAAKRGITVTDDEVEKALRAEIANQQGLITEPQATETAVAGVTATADAVAAATATAQATPVASTEISGTTPVSGTEAISGTSPITDTGAAPTTAVTETTVITPTGAVASSVVTASEGLSGTEGISATTSLTEAVQVSNGEIISPTATPEPIPTRAIITDALYAEGQATLEANLKQVANFDLATYRQITRVRLLRDKLREAIGADVPTTEEEVKASHILLREILPTPTVSITDTVNITPTATATALPEGAPTPTATPAPRTLDEAMAQAKELKARIDAGEDFAALAKQYSDDPGSGANGGDLGWFAHGAMVAEFDTHAFSLPVGQVSEPFTSTFGVHILKVTEKDDKHPKDQQKIDQERSQAYDTWLQEQLAADDIKRPSNLTGNLPRDLRQTTTSATN